MLRSDSHQCSPARPGTGRGVLYVYVVQGCRACERTLQALESCDELHELVEVSIASLENNDESVPKGVVGAPTLVFNGKVVSLGTPDCRQLVARLRQQVNRKETV
jgi:alkyl hydroperoxide reductase subunit AhpF